MDRDTLTEDRCRGRGAVMASLRLDLLREAASLVASARRTEDSQEAAALIMQAADILDAVTELLELDDPDVSVH